MQAIDHIEDNNNVVILYGGDTPLITHETIEKLMKYHKKNKCSGTVLTAFFRGSNRIWKDC